MGKLNEALDRIAELTDTDTEWARRFCREVQANCRISPPYQLIADALESRGTDDLSVRGIAELASQLHGLGNENVVSADEPPIESRQPLSVTDAIRDDNTIRSATDSLVELIARRSIDRLISESIEGKAIGFTGNGPFMQEDLEHLAIRLGGLTGREGVSWEQLDWIIVGRTDFDEEFLEYSTLLPGLQYFSQEEFLGLLLFGERAVAHDRIALEAKSHSGIQWVEWWLNQNEDERLGAPSVEVHSEEDDAPDEIVLDSSVERGASFDWPRLVTVDSDQPLEATNGWADESELKKIGYSVAKGITLLRRQTALDAGVKMLGLQRVASHVAFLIRTNRNNTRRQSAVSNWEHDLNWLRSRYGSS